MAFIRSAFTSMLLYVSFVDSVFRYEDCMGYVFPSIHLIRVLHHQGVAALPGYSGRITPVYCADVEKTIFYACLLYSYDYGNNHSLINLSIFEILPDPVDLRGNLTVTAHAELTEDIPDSALLEVKYYSVRRIFGVKVDILIPCLLGKYGSCTLPFCHYMNRYEKQVCPFFSNATSCECPIRVGSYEANEVDVEMPKPSLMTRLLARGKYRTEMKLKDIDTGEELACYKFYTELG